MGKRIKLFRKENIIRLVDLDELYEKTILQLPYEARIHYCENLIANCLLDLKNENNKMKIDRINQLIKAAGHEIIIMNSN